MKIHPRSCLILPAKATIRDVVTQLRENAATFAILHDMKNKICGVVTEKDFLYKTDILELHKHLNKPVSVIMSHPIQVLSIDLIHKAPEFMVANGIRRVPIMTRKNSLDINEFIGVVTAESLLQEFVDSRSIPLFTPPNLLNISEKTIGVLSGDGELYRNLSKLFYDSDKVRVQRIPFGKMKSINEVKYYAQNSDAIIVDIDDTPKHSWVQLVREFNQNPDLETVVVAYSPEKHEATTVSLMSALKSQGTFLVYEKPLNISQLLRALEDEWVSKDSKEAS